MILRKAFNRNAFPSSFNLCGRLPLTLAAVSLLFVQGCSMEEQLPPEAAYTQAEAYVPMEEAVSETVAALPDFPGFDQRSWAEIPCSHEGGDSSEYTNIEIRYMLSKEDSETPTVREDFVHILREEWEAREYNLSEDSAVELESRTDRELSAIRDDGITLWYSVAGTVGLMVQSGCVPRVDRTEVPYVPPSGGIEPGSEADTVAHSNRYFPDGVSEDQLTSEATDITESPSSNE